MAVGARLPVIRPDFLTVEPQSVPFVDTRSRSSRLHYKETGRVSFDSIGLAGLPLHCSVVGWIHTTKNLGSCRQRRTLFYVHFTEPHVGVWTMDDSSAATHAVIVTMYLSSWRASKLLELTTPITDRRCV